MASNLLALASNLEAMTPTSGGLQPNSNGLQPISDGLQPSSDGLLVTKTIDTTRNFGNLTVSWKLMSTYLGCRNSECTFGTAEKILEEWTSD